MILGPLKSDAKSDLSPQGSGSKSDQSSHSSVTGFGSPPFDPDIGQNTTIQAIRPGVDRNQLCPFKYCPSSQDLLKKFDAMWYERYQKQAKEIDEKWFQRWNEQNKVIRDLSEDIAGVTVGIHFQFSF